MAEKKDLVEDALLQMKNLEEAVAQNAKGILAATMGQEIKELVKESLSEQDDEDEIEDMGDEPMMGMDDEDSDVEMDDEESDMEMGMDTDMEMDTDMDMSDDDDEVIDLTNASDEEILKVFKAMGDEDGIIVKKDEDMVHLEDTNEGVEYMIDLGESDEEEMGESSHNMEMDEESDEMEMDEAYNEMDEMSMDMDEGYDEMDETMVPPADLDMDEESEGIVYEISLDDEELDEEEDMEESYKEEENEEYDFEKVETKEGTMSVKPKGVGMGKPKFSYDKKVNEKGFNDDKKQGTRGVGMGKGPKKFEYKEGKKMETKEASRTLGVGKAFGKPGLPKKKTAPRHLHTESVSQTENLKNQVEILREKNEEYRKALNIFRQKLNEVAVFNSNLAYATRLFTEHTTTKQEKINILRRFDGVESIKESKSLYKTLKDELSGKQGKVVTESFDKVIDREPQSGSATNLIESKTYENPQFLRMKDLMSKLTK